MSERFEGEVTTALKGIGETQTLIREEFQRSQAENTRQHEKMFTSLEATNLGMVEVKTAFDGHVKDDNRRFGLVWRFFLAIAGVAGSLLVAAKVFS